MTTQSEQTLENNLIQQLIGLGYESVSVTDDKQLVANFRVLMRIKNILSSYSYFCIDDLGMDKQTFEDFKSKYLDLYGKVKQRALKAFSKAENLDLKRLDSVIEDYIYTDRKPLRDDVISMMDEKPKLKERSTTAERLIQKVTHYVDTFISGMGL